MKPYLLSLSVLFIAFFSQAQLPSYLPSNGLAAWYPFNGNTVDESSNSNNGAVSGASLTSDRFGNANSAYYFNGTSDFISVADNITLDFSTQFSFSLWLYLEDYSLGAQNERVVISKQRGPDESGMLLNAVSGYNQLKYAARVTDGNVSGGPTANETLSLEAWEHLIVVYNGSTLVMYRNGALSASSSVSVSLLNSSQPLYIGKEFNSAGRFFKGKVDDVALWNRPLNGEEIMELYTSVTTGVDMLAEAESMINVYPNPATSYLRIDGDIAKVNGHMLRIDNCLGQTVLTTPITQKKLTVDLSTWNVKGIYFVYVIDKTKSVVEVKRIVLQ